MLTGEQYSQRQSNIACANDRYATLLPKLLADIREVHQRVQSVFVASACDKTIVHVLFLCVSSVASIIL